MVRQKRTIAIVCGGDSSEHDVSMRSGQGIYSFIDKDRYNVYIVELSQLAWHAHLHDGMTAPIDRNDFSFEENGKVIQPDYAYITIHGTPGENGLLQGYLEMLGIPFSSCSAFVSAIAFDKFACKSYLREVDFVKCAPDVYVRNGMDIESFCRKVVEKLKFPVFVKPTDGGSSFGITKVRKAEDLPEAIRFAFSEGPSVIIEQGIPGQEFTCAAYADAEGVKSLPVIQIVTEHDYFDYDAKYNGQSQEICPAPISEDLSGHIQEVSKRIYSHLGCSGVVRMDYILAEDGLYFLEVNTIPGMTSASLVPKMVRTAGLDITDFLTGIIENS